MPPIRSRRSGARSLGSARITIRPSSKNITLPRSEGSSAIDICAKFITKTKDGRQDVIVLGTNAPVTIGRSSKCSYVLPEAVVSNVHCKLYAVRSATGGIIVSCQDTSTNGIILNNHKIRKSSVIVMQGDTVKLPMSQTFECTYIWKAPPEKSNIFDSTPVTQPQKQKKIGHYVVTSHCLGSGSFATVHLAIDGRNKRQVACKSIKTRKINSSESMTNTSTSDFDVLSELKEFKIMLLLHHPNITRVYDVHVKDQFLNIFLQLSTGGDLFTYITTQADLKLGEGESQWIMYQLLLGLEYLHERWIAHRDLKPENILLYNPGPYPRIQIADFGLAREKSYQETFNVCGTVAYLPPEGVLALEHKGLSYVGMPADCWSAGVVLYIMLSGRHPFDSPNGSNHADTYVPEDGVSDDDLDDGSVDSDMKSRYFHGEHQTKYRIVYGEAAFDGKEWARIPTDAILLINELLKRNPQDRFTVNEAMESDWISQDIDELTRAYERLVTSSS